MMIFLGDGYVNLDHVKKLQFSSDGTSASVHFTDGSSETLSCHSATHWSVDDSTVIQANPGLSLLTLHDFAGKGPLELAEEMIIAFRVPRSGFYAAPITIHGEVERDIVPWHWAIKRPNGTVSSPQGEDFSDRDKYVAEMQKRWREKYGETQSRVAPHARRKVWPSDKCLRDGCNRTRLMQLPARHLAS
jgi:hypothetical protein